LPDALCAVLRVCCRSARLLASPATAFATGGQPGDGGEEKGGGSHQESAPAAHWLTLPGLPGCLQVWTEKFSRHHQSRFAGMSNRQTRTENRASNPSHSHHPFTPQRRARQARLAPAPEHPRPEHKAQRFGQHPDTPATSDGQETHDWTREELAAHNVQQPGALLQLSSLHAGTALHLPDASGANAARLRFSTSSHQKKIVSRFPEKEMSWTQTGLALRHARTQLAG
jgi:hypothetical protein